MMSLGVIDGLGKSHSILDAWVLSFSETHRCWGTPGLGIVVKGASVSRPCLTLEREFTVHSTTEERKGLHATR